jgi:hypothetical protein
LNKSAIKPPFQVYLGCEVYEHYVNRICVTVCTNAGKSNISNILHIFNINKIFKLWTHLNKKGAVFWYVRPYAAPILYPEDGGTRFLQSFELLRYCTRHIHKAIFFVISVTYSNFILRQLLHKHNNNDQHHHPSRLRF